MMISKKELLSSRSKSHENIKTVSIFGMRLRENCFVPILDEDFFGNSDLFISSDKKREKRQSSPSSVLWMSSFVDFSRKYDQQIYLSEARRSDDDLRSMLVIFPRLHETLVQNFQNLYRMFLHEVFS